MSKVGGLDRSMYRQLTEATAKVFAAQDDRIKQHPEVERDAASPPVRANNSPARAMSPPARVVSPPPVVASQPSTFNHKAFTAPDPSAKPWNSRRSEKSAILRPRSRTIDMPVREDTTIRGMPPAVKFAAEPPAALETPAKLPPKTPAETITKQENAADAAKPAEKTATTVQKDAAKVPVELPKSALCTPIEATKAAEVPLKDRRATKKQIQQMLEEVNPPAEKPRTPSFYTRELEYVTVQLYDGTRCVSLESAKKLKLQKPYSLPDMTTEAFDIVWRRCIGVPTPDIMANSFIADRSLQEH